jgi:hypothetical protein
MSGFADKEIISGLTAVLIPSYAAFFTWVVASISRLDRRIRALDVMLSSSIDEVKAKLSARIDTIDARLSARLQALTMAVSRLEGAMWRRTPP